MDASDAPDINLMLAKYSEYECGAYQKGNYANGEDLVSAFLENKAFIFDTNKYYESQFGRRIAPVICNAVICLISLALGDVYWAAILCVILIIMLIYALVGRVGTKRSFVIVSTTGVLVKGQGISYMPWREVARVSVETLSYKKSGTIIHRLFLYGAIKSKIIIPVEGSDTSELLFEDQVLGLSTLVKTYWDLGRQPGLKPDVDNNPFDLSN